jgi:hypothetical protein
MRGGRFGHLMILIRRWHVSKHVSAKAISSMSNFVSPSRALVRLLVCRLNLEVSPPFQSVLHEGV